MVNRRSLGREACWAFSFQRCIDDPHIGRGLDGETDSRSKSNTSSALLLQQASFATADLDRAI
jgi:hypothetical protein